ncbi:hypothetical protein, partial [Escherichia coli]|uniref:hypothetical protein n=1 Tax=Escherichia coli TaxID=562 RepID=UPI003C793FB0
DRSRQFIVSKVQLDAAEERVVRRAFWYRQALFSRLSGAWRTLAHSHSLGFTELGAEEDMVRCGKVPLRGLVSSGGLTLDNDDASLLHLQK